MVQRWNSCLGIGLFLLLDHPVLPLLPLLTRCWSVEPALGHLWEAKKVVIPTVLLTSGLFRVVPSKRGRHPGRPAALSLLQPSLRRPPSRLDARNRA